MYFQHNNKILINENTYKYVREYKKQLLYNITTLLNDLEIKFVISHGNLIEFARNKPLYHDDDLDIRFDSNDLQKWEIFCKDNNEKLDKYNLCFDSRFHNLEKQKYNGIQCCLIKFNNPDNIEEFEMDIHCDLVMNKVKLAFWMNYNINFSKIRKVTYLEIETSAPSVNDTIMVLKTQYGDNYLIPDRKTLILSEIPINIQNSTNPINSVILKKMILLKNRSK